MIDTLDIRVRQPALPNKGSPSWANQRNKNLYLYQSDYSQYCEVLRYKDIIQG